MYDLIISSVQNGLLMQVLDDNKRIVASLYIDNYSLQNLKNVFRLIQ